MMTTHELARKIDHTILKAEATFEQVRNTILYAREVDAASVCLNPAYVALATQLLKGTDVAVCTVIGFPLGANSSYTKAKETENAYQYGAREMDMVLNISALKSGDYDFVQKDIEAVVKASPALVKVILENCYLTRDEIVTACKLVEQAGAQFVKTSTGFGPSGATLQDVRLMRKSIGPNMKIKAAGGIGSLADALAMIKAGADRIGMSRTAGVLKELEDENATSKAATSATKKEGRARTSVGKTSKAKPVVSAKPTSKKQAPAKPKTVRSKKPPETDK